jgi:hypothetical protein
MKLRPLALGLAIGIFWGVMMFLTTWLCIYTGYGRLFLEAFMGLYPGYSITPAGSLLVLVYGFIDGFVFGAGIGWLYNRFAK